MRALVVFAVVVGCGGPQHPGAPAARDALLAWVPEDAFAVVATLEPVPFEMLDVYKRMAEPAIAAADADGKLAGVLAATGFTWSREGLEAAGIEPSPRFVVYAYDTTFVFRVAVRDEAKVRNLIEHLNASDAKPLREQKLGERRYWKRATPSGDVDVFALVDGQFVVASGPPAQVTRQLPNLLVAPPARAMAPAALREAARAHGYDGIVAVIDVRRMLSAMVIAKGGTPTPACTTEIDRLAARTPRIVGEMALSAKVYDMRVVVELAPDLAAELRAVRRPVPGLAAELARNRLLTFGAAVDLPAAHAAALRWSEGLGRVGDACAWPGPTEARRKIVARIGKPIPEPFARARSVLGSLRTLAFDRRGLPSRLEGFVALGIPGRELLEVLEHEPRIKALGMVADGELHPLAAVQGLLAFAVLVGADDTSFTVALDAKGAEMAAQARAAGDEPPGPLLTLSGDYGRLLELMGTRPGADPKSRQDGQMGAFVGHTEITLDMHGDGLELISRYDIK